MKNNKSIFAALLIFSGIFAGMPAHSQQAPAVSTKLEFFQQLSMTIATDKTLSASAKQSLCDNVRPSIVNDVLHKERLTYINSYRLEMMTTVYALAVHCSNNSDKKAEVRAVLKTHLESLSAYLNKVAPNDPSGNDKVIKYFETYFLKNVDEILDGRR